ncbi:hypothetical protein ABZY14_35080 [Streptomyces sp. NPDC006617]|uniref:hypothetical protein n=1 Tax=Streptomyces sp. NPDC006617 TaxID=3155354 RepID=UPI0033AC59CC
MRWPQDRISGRLARVEPRCPAWQLALRLLLNLPRKSDQAVLVSALTPLATHLLRPLPVLTNIEATTGK